LRNELTTGYAETAITYGISERRASRGSLGTELSRCTQQDGRAAERAGATEYVGTGHSADADPIEPGRI